MRRPCTERCSTRCPRCRRRRALGRTSAPRRCRPPRRPRSSSWSSRDRTGLRSPRTRNRVRHRRTPTHRPRPARRGRWSLRRRSKPGSAAGPEPRRVVGDASSGQHRPGSPVIHLRDPVAPCSWRLRPAIRGGMTSPRRAAPGPRCLFRDSLALRRATWSHDQESRGPPRPRRRPAGEAPRTSAAPRSNRGPSPRRRWAYARATSDR